MIDVVNTNTSKLVVGQRKDLDGPNSQVRKHTNTLAQANQEYPFLLAKCVANCVQGHIAFIFSL